MRFLKLLFDLNLYYTSFKIPVIKLVVSALTMLVICILRLSFTITNKALNLTISIAAIVVVIASIMCFFVAAVEALQVSENKKNMKKR